MSTLPYFNSSVTKLCNAIDATNNDEWIKLQYVITIHDLENEGRDLLNKEESKKRKIWEPQKNSAVRKQLDEAESKDAPEDSLYKRIYIEAGSLYPVLIIALICNRRNNGALKVKANKLRAKKSKQAPEEGIGGPAEEEDVDDAKTLEEELKLWPIVFFKALVKRLMTITPPFKISQWREIRDHEKKIRKILTDYIPRRRKSLM